MNKCILLLVFLLFGLITSAQVIRKGERFEKVSIIEDKVSFVKELIINNKSEKEKFEILKQWAKKNYLKQPFASTILYDIENREVIVKSETNLILLPNEKSIREKVQMNYRLSVFLFQNKCVLEISDISYIPQSQNGQKVNRMAAIKAEAFITDQAITKISSHKEFKVNTRKSTLHFVNGLAYDFERQFL